MNETTPNVPGQPVVQAAPVSKGKLWAGWIMGALPALFLLFDAGMKLAKPEFVVKATVELGYRESTIVPLGVVLLISTLLYLIPGTSMLGAILLTGYLGGAVDAQVHAGKSLGEILFPVIFGVLLWGGLFLRDTRVSRLIPFRRRSE
jgi:hypothetical protein